jgi:hypothetical protein
MPDSARVKITTVHYPEKDTKNQITEEIRETYPPGEIQGMRDLPPEETTEIWKGHVRRMTTHDHVIYVWSLTEVAQVVMMKEE